MSSILTSRPDASSAYARRLSLCLALVASFALFPLTGHGQPNYVFSTLAGVAAFGSIDGTGSTARFFSPAGIARDSSGNLYLADTNNCTIRKVTPAGVVTTLAGLPGSYGAADGTGSAARFSYPSGLAVDSSGNVFVADTENETIRKVTPAGVVTTFAGMAGFFGHGDGTGGAARFSTPTALAIDSSGNLYVADFGNNLVRKISPAGNVTTLAGNPGQSGSNDGTGSGALFSFPNGIAVDGAGNVFVGDSANNTIRKITPAGVVTTLAGLAANSGNTDGTGSAARFNSPAGVTVDASGNIYVADEGNSLIRKITGAGVVTTVAGKSGITGWIDGNGTNAEFYFPNGVVTDASGNVLVADTNNSVIRKVTSAGNVTTFVGLAGGEGFADGAASVARFNGPFGAALDGSGNIYVTDLGNHSIRKVASSGMVTTIAGMSGVSGNVDGTGGTASFASPTGIGADGNGNFFVADADNANIRKVTAAGVVTTYASGSFVKPKGVAADSAGNLYVADSDAAVIFKVAPGGAVSVLAGSLNSAGSTDGTGTAAKFSGPSGVAIDGAGNIYVADSGNCTIRKVTPGGVVTTFAGTAGRVGSLDGRGSFARFSTPVGLAFDATGNLFVTDKYYDNLRRVTPSGVVTTVGGNSARFGSTDGAGRTALFNGPTGVVVDSAGRLIVVDSQNCTIREGTPAAANGDFNGDGHADLVWQNLSTGQRSVWFLNGTAFVSSGSFDSISGEWAIVATADFNSDGKQDLLWQNTSTGERLIWLMDGTNFVSSVALGTVSTDWTIAGAGDFNGDGSPDLLWQNTSTGERLIWLMNGTAYSTTVSLGTAPTNVVIVGTGDFNGDGQTDILVENTSTGAVNVWLMDGTSLDSTVSLGQLPANNQVAGVGDYNGDGQPDILLTNTATGDRNVWLMNGTSVASTVYLTTVSTGWTLERPFPAHPPALAPDDFNADGNSDLVWQNTSTGDRFVWLMNGTSYSSGVSLGSISTDWAIVGNGDFNGDGRNDLLWQNAATGERLIWLMNGTAYASSVSLGTVSPDWSIAGAADMNGDGQADILWQNAATGERAIWLMNGTAYSATVSLGSMSTDWTIVGAGDFNGDGQADLVWQNSSTGEHYLWLMNGTAFASAVSIGTMSTDWTIAGSGDFNADGQADLVWQNTATGARYIWLMNGTSFASAVSLGTVSTDWSIRN